VPVFTVFTNAQLAEMVRMPVSTAADLGKIDGVGETRVTKYGKEVLAELAQSRTPAGKEVDEANEGIV
jgi:ATP-dependent DNA helicase RecQ